MSFFPPSISASTYLKKKSPRLLEDPLLLPPVDVSLQLAGGTKRAAPGHHEVITERPLNTHTHTVRGEALERGAANDSLSVL